MEIFELENIYNGIIYIQSTALGAVMLSLTLKARKDRKRSIMLWFCVVVFAFLTGILSRFTVSQAGGMIMEAASGIEEMWKVQMCYSLVSVMNVLEGSVAAVILGISAVWICEGRKNIKIFVSILFMVLFSSVFYVFKQIMYGLFSTGIDEFSLSRIPPHYGMRLLIDCIGLAVLFAVYRYFFREKLVHILEIAEEQICQIVLVPAMSYLLFLTVRYMLDSYGITLLSIDPGSFLMALIIIICLLAIYLLMFWSIFRAILASASSAKVKAELDVASKIQLSALPTSFDIGKEKGVDIFANMHPAKEVGGDFYDFFFVDEDHLAVLIADVSGKGVPAALFMMSARTMIKNQSFIETDPAKVLGIVNNQLAENNEEGMFVTTFLAVYDLTTRELTFSNGGHNPPYIVRADGTVEQVSVRPGFVLGGMEGIRYRNQSIQMDIHDKLLLYTDGVTEAVNPQFELYAESRLEKVLLHMEKLSPKESIEKIISALKEFADGAEQADDITMVVLQICE